MWVLSAEGTVKLGKGNDKVICYVNKNTLSERRNTKLSLVIADFSRV